MDTLMIRTLVYNELCSVIPDKVPSSFLMGSIDPLDQIETDLAFLSS